MSRSVRQLTRGYFNLVQHDGQALRAIGWLLRIDQPFDEIRLSIDGRVVASGPPNGMHDVAAAFPWIPHAVHSGFATLQPNAPSSGALEAAGLSRGRVCGSIKTIFSRDLGALGPLPPTRLMLRAAGNENSDFFRADGQRTFADFASAVERHGGFSRVRRMLDWGSGCGRVTAHFLADGRIGEVHGVDIDGEATAWCQAALPGGRFQQTGAYPPLPFPEGHFDLVVAYSVFTHLALDLQRAWLREMRRVLAPGGLLLATVHGEFAALFNLPRHKPRSLLERARLFLGRRPVINGGIVDSIPDHALDGIAPDGYYRGVFQTKRFTLREWSRILDVVEFRDAGVGNYQDLVVLKKPAK